MISKISYISSSSYYLIKVNVLKYNNLLKGGEGSNAGLVKSSPARCPIAC